jgi:hypothetical protein
LELLPKRETRSTFIITLTTHICTRLFAPSLSRATRGSRGATWSRWLWGGCRGVQDFGSLEHFRRTVCERLRGC